MLLLHGLQHRRKPGQLLSSFPAIFPPVEMRRNGTSNADLRAKFVDSQNGVSDDIGKGHFGRRDQEHVLLMLGLLRSE